MKKRVIKMLTSMIEYADKNQNGDLDGYSTEYVKE